MHLTICETLPQIGEAISKNPGYLKLKKIRAAQNIAKTVSYSLCNHLVSRFIDQHVTARPLLLLT